MVWWGGGAARGRGQAHAQLPSAVPPDRAARGPGKNQEPQIGHSTLGLALRAPYTKGTSCVRTAAVSVYCSTASATRRHVDPTHHLHLHVHVHGQTGTGHAPACGCRPSQGPYRAQSGPGPASHQRPRGPPSFGPAGWTTYFATRTTVAPPWARLNTCCQHAYTLPWSPRSRGRRRTRKSSAAASALSRRRASPPPQRRLRAGSDGSPRCPQRRNAHSARAPRRASRGRPRVPRRQ